MSIQRSGDEVLANGEHEHVHLPRGPADDYDVQCPQDGADEFQGVATVNLELIVHAQKIHAPGCDQGPSPGLPTDSLPPTDGHHDRYQDDIEPGEKTGIAGRGVFHPRLLADRGHDQQGSRDRRPVEECL